MEIAFILPTSKCNFYYKFASERSGHSQGDGCQQCQLITELLLDFAKPIMIANAIACPLGTVLAAGYISLFAAQTSVTAVPFLMSLLLSVMIAEVAVISQSLKSSRIRPAMVLKYE